MMTPTYSTSGVKSIVGKFQGVAVSTSPVQVSGSSTDANGHLVNGPLTALVNASSAVPTNGIPSYYCQLIQISDPTATIYVGRDSNVSGTNYIETMNVGNPPIQYEANGSLPLWIYCASNATCSITFSQ